MVPNPELVPAITRVCDPKLSPLQRGPAAVAVRDATARAGNGRLAMLLRARQSLTVCLRCWQRMTWWPDAAEALLGYYPSPSPVLDMVARQEAQQRGQVGGGG
jgi:hypothetical protein